tara:strand:- start:2357 stop:2758 length:402 start_codon:yes stop_codon:yes gene_type:complete
MDELDELDEYLPGTRRSDYISLKMKDPNKLMYWGDIEMANLLAKKRDYNRQLDTEAIKTLVEDMIAKSGYKVQLDTMRFPATALMVHSHKNGEECMPHMRISINMGEARVMLDCDMDLWESFTKFDLEDIENV